MKRLLLRSAARDDILNYFEFLSNRGAARAAELFLPAVENALVRISEMPGVGSPRELENPQLIGLRSHPVPGFEVLRFYYLDSEDAVRVIRLLHGNRDVRSLLEAERPDLDD